MTVVVDASIAVAALVDGGDVGSWAESVLAGGNLIAPHVMPLEVTNILRRSEGAGTVTADSAGLAFHDLRSMPVTLLPFEPVARRVWQLRSTVTAYDAVYVAWAEALGCPLATIDGRLARASGPRCPFLLPDHPQRP